MLTIVSVLVVSSATCGDTPRFVKRVQHVLAAGRAAFVDDEGLSGEVLQAHPSLQATDVVGGVMRLQLIANSSW